MGRFGLVVDALLSVRVVVADGRPLHVSEDSYPELFWGIRGAGANFGVVTSATYKLQRVARSAEHAQGQVLMADMVIPATQSARYFELLESFNQSAPENLAIASVVVYGETSGDVSHHELSLPPPVVSSTPGLQRHPMLPSPVTAF